MAAEETALFLHALLLLSLPPSLHPGTQAGPKGTDKKNKNSSSYSTCVGASRAGPPSTTAQASQLAAPLVSDVWDLCGHAAARLPETLDANA